MDTALSAAEAEADVFRDLVARRKVVESRFNLGVYSRYTHGSSLQACFFHAATLPKVLVPGFKCSVSSTFKVLHRRFRFSY